MTDLKTRWRIYEGPNPWTSDFFKTVHQESNIELLNGYAYFKTQKLTTPINISGTNYYYTSGEIVSKFDDIPYCSSFSDAGYLYGMFEIRCKLPKKHGQYPAYWLLGNTSWPPEIDLFEFNGNDHNMFFSGVHWGPNNAPQNCYQFYNYPFDLTDDFHTWTVVWSPTAVTFFFDNKELRTDNIITHIPGTVSPNMMERCKWMKMKHQIGSGLNWPYSSETTFDPLIVDYIKVYKPTGYTPYTTGNFDNYNYNIIYFRNTANQLVKLLLNTSSSSATVISTISDVFSSLAINPTSNRIYYKTSTNNLIYYTLSGATWTRYAFNAVSPYSGTSSVPVDNVAKNICLGENPHQVYYIGTDNRVWVVYWDGTWRSTAIDWKVNYATRDLKITNPTTSNKTLCFVGADNKIRRFYWNTCEVLNPACNNHQYFKQGNSNISTENIVANTSDIIITPNPATDIIKINLPADFTGITNIEIYNINGQKVKQLNTDIATNSVPISDLTNGLYVIKIENSKKTSIQKFYKN